MYSIQDGSGYQTSGAVIIHAQGSSSQAGSTMTYMTDPFTPVYILVDDDSYHMADPSTLGKGDLEKGSYHLIYHPRPTAVGQEAFELVNNSGEKIHVLIDIMDDPLSGLAVKDDIYYTSIGTPVTFDPRSNDYNRDGVIIDYSDDLSFDGEQFTFAPGTTTGAKSFYYVVLDGTKEIRGNIDIYIGDYLPARDEYHFETFQNTPFVIEYDAPIRNYQWTSVQDPRRGILTLTVGTYAGGSCDIVNGRRMVVYEPNSGFTGSDQFTISYCLSNGTCKDVIVHMNVKPASEACPCVGSDCVWAGDADNDGEVSVKDVLAIGYNYGEIGFARNNDSDWFGQHATDWPFFQEDASVNNKYADTNGDGMITASDVDVLEQHIHLYHSINAEEVLALKELPLSFVPRTPKPYVAGQEVIFDVYLGSTDLPVQDLKGVVFSASFPTDLVDPNSISFTPSEEWLGHGSPIISAVSVQNGVLEVGLARTVDLGIFGKGKIGETGIAILADVDGSRPKGGSLDGTIKTQSQIATSRGRVYSIPTATLDIEVRLGDISADEVAQVTLAPNPSDQAIRVYTAQGEDLVEVRIYNGIGALMATYPSIDKPLLEIQHTWPQGMYTAHIKTQRGFTVEKLLIVDHR